MMETGESWRSEFIARLNEETNLSASWLKILEAYNRLSQSNLTLREKNDKLEDRLKHQTPASAVEAELAKKNEDLQKELTESYKSRGERTQQLLDMTKSVNTYKVRLQELETSESNLSTKNEELQKKEKENTITIQVLHDEIRTLQLELISMSQKYDQMEKDNENFVSMIREKAESAAQARNECNRLEERLQQEIKKTAMLAKEGGRPLKAPSAKELMGSSRLMKEFSGLPTKVDRRFEAHGSGINSIAYCNIGSKFVTGGDDKTVATWDSSGSETARYKGCTQGVMTVCFSPKDDFVLGGCNDEATYIWNTRTNRLSLTLTGHQGKVFAAKFCGDSSKVVTGSHDRTIKIWDLNKGYCIKTIFSFSSCNDIVLSDDNGTGIISGHLDNHIRFWDTKSWQCTNELTGVHTNQITSIDISPDRNTILTNSKDNTLKLIDLRMFQVLSTFCGDGYKTGMIWSRACFSPNGLYVAAGSADGNLYLWNTQTAKLEAIKKGGHYSAIAACAWSPVSSQLITCDKSKTVVLWDHT